MPAAEPEPIYLAQDSESLVLISVELDRDGLQHHPQPVSAIVVGGSEEVAPRGAKLLIDKLDGDVLLLGAPLVHLGDLAHVPLVVGRAEPAPELLASLEVVRQPRRARQHVEAHARRREVLGLKGGERRSLLLARRLLLGGGGVVYC